MSGDDFIRGLILVLLLIAFLGMVVWAWSKKRTEDFELMSQLPLDDDDVQITNKEER